MKNSVWDIAVFFRTWDSRVGPGLPRLVYLFELKRTCLVNVSFGCRTMCARYFFWDFCKKEESDVVAHIL